MTYSRNAVNTKSAFYNRYPKVDYLDPNWHRINVIKNRICEQMIHCAEVRAMAIIKKDVSLSEAMIDRHLKLERRMDRIAGIEAKL